MLFRDIYGQDQIKRKLIRTIVEQRVSHAQLFYGPEGSGKLALAIAYAQLLNCSHPQPLPQSGEGGREGVDSCGTCPSCQQFQKLAHPDLHFVYPNNTTKKVPKNPSSLAFIAEWRKFLLEQNFSGSLNDWYDQIGIENKQGTINVRDAEEIIHTLGYMSYESEYKVMIIWMVDKLYHAVSPKLLKILEEPPDKTLFILITIDPGQVLPTIASRCLPVRIPPLVGPKEVVDADETGNYEIFRKWMLACHAKKHGDLVAFAADVSKIGREKQKQLLGYGLEIARNCSQYNHTRQVPDSFPEEQEFIRKFSSFFPYERLEGFSELFNQAVFHVERNAHAPTLFLDLSLKMTRFFSPGS